ncbi:PP2C family protein-serine/threonine phosphatase [Streptomyces millisiae]|uniref:PP2C family protein-serine/threonine phosphatase n=1 Tax=Streptomyces millisiae TaxID=3075542 RepID=A0ABU2LUL5_9ACTN|nr:PP2C family protein-serine/threonine phosphatase [Streptomyces sp. DSM 44918]MDT0321287.1 PP2C family protein-serine/threonine phosphatase [Streptomyces sp. DSM 44918]
MRTGTPWWAGGGAWYPWLPLVLLVVGTVADLLTPPHLTLTPLYVAAPMLAAPVLSLRVTALYGLLATASVGVQMLLREPSVGEAIVKVTTVATISALAVVVNRIVARRDRRLASAREVAEAVQRAVVPEPPDRAGTLRVATRYQAAQRDTLIGGDLYAVRETPFGVRLLVGDVRGKGLAATEAVAVILGAFREVADREPELAEVAAYLEAALVREREQRAPLDPVEGFTTAVLAEVPRERPVTVRILNRGHPQPVLLTPDGDACYLEAEPALPLGLGDLLPTPMGRVRSTPFPPGSHLLLYTDGVSEARDEHGVFFDPVEDLNGRSFPGPGLLLDRVVADVVKHSTRLNDDMALLALHHPEPRGTPEDHGA